MASATASKEGAPSAPLDQSRLGPIDSQHQNFNNLFAFLGGGLVRDVALSRFSGLFMSISFVSFYLEASFGKTEEHSAPTTTTTPTDDDTTSISVSFISGKYPLASHCIRLSADYLASVNIGQYPDASTRAISFIILRSKTS